MQLTPKNCYQRPQKKNKKPPKQQHWNFRQDLNPEWLKSEGEKILMEKKKKEQKGTSS